MKIEQPKLIIIAGPNGSGKTSVTGNRLYVYDNSVDYVEPKLLFRATNGKLEKIYTDVNVWAQSILTSFY